MIPLFLQNPTVVITLENEINTAINNVVQWLNYNNLTVNLRKTSIMYFTQIKTVPSKNISSIQYEIGTSCVRNFHSLSDDIYYC